MSLRDHLPELADLERLIHLSDSPYLKVRKLDSIFYHGEELPIYGLILGPDDNSIPTFMLTGGVHGLERVGTLVVLSYISSFLEQLKWDEEYMRRLEHCRIISIPLINPVGMALLRRGNGNGVDLMRNAPIDADDDWPFLVSGHRISSRLYWYRGQLNAAMEKEARVIEKFIKHELFPCPFAMGLDVHSGFGFVDRLWYPYAKTVNPFPDEQTAQRLKRLFRKTYPYHSYKVEPQSVHYTTHGDLWDYFYDTFKKDNPDRLYIPWTLEMGSWRWAKKNPAQIFTLLGLFNPIKTHRVNRVLRGHLLMIDFLYKATSNYKNWMKYEV